MKYKDWINEWLSVYVRPTVTFFGKISLRP